MNAITNNDQLKAFVSTLTGSENLFAIRTKNLIEIFTNKKSFNKKLKATPDAVNGNFNSSNFIWFRF